MILHPATPGGAATAGQSDVARWRPSSDTGNGQSCVEVALSATGVLLRDTKDHGTGPVLTFTAVRWARFLQETRAGAPSANGATLRFTPGERTAFRSGVRDQEFDGLATV